MAKQLYIFSLIITVVSAIFFIAFLASGNTLFGCLFLVFGILFSYFLRFIADLLEV